MFSSVQTTFYSFWNNETEQNSERLISVSVPGKFWIELYLSKYTNSWRTFCLQYFYNIFLSSPLLLSYENHWSHSWLLVCSLGHSVPWVVSNLVQLKQFLIWYLCLDCNDKKRPRNIGRRIGFYFNHFSVFLSLPRSILIVSWGFIKNKQPRPIWNEDKVRIAKDNAHSIV